MEEAAVICTLFTAAWFLGFTPIPGKTYIVHRAKLAGYTQQQINDGTSCARKLKIKYKLIGRKAR
jgi:hypothetical protein